MSSLNLKHSHSQGDNPATSTLIFHLLHDFIQPKSSFYMEEVAVRIEQLLPDTAAAPFSFEEDILTATMLEIAAQIPYHHPSQLKLPRLLAQLADSPKVVHTRDVRVS